MGLLDNILGGSFDDPRTAATLQLAQGLLSSPKVMQGMAGGLLGYQQTMQQAKQQKALEEMRAMQLAQHSEALKQSQMQRAAMERQQAFLQGLQSPQQQATSAALAGGMSGAFKPGFSASTNSALDAFLGGGTKAAPVANAPQMPKADPQQEMLFKAVQAGVMPISSYIESMRKDDTPITVAPGAALLNRRTLQPIFTNPKEDTTPGDWKLYQLSGAAQRGLTFDQWDKERRRASATNVTVSTEKGYGEKVAGGLAERDLAAIDAARSAPDSIASAQRIRQILNSQKAFTGTGAEVRLGIAKALSTAGIVNGESVTATEDLQRELSQGVLGHIKSSGLGGGSGFSNADRDFLEKAAAGKIDVNAATLARTAELSERAARKAIESGNAASKRMRNAPGLSTLPFPDVIQQPSSNVVDFGSLK
jgi:hypothetical protein